MAVSPLRYMVRGMSSDDFPENILGVHVVEYGPDARVVTVAGEVDALTASKLSASLTAQLAVAQVVVVNLDEVRLLGSAGLRALFEANELAIRQDRELRLVCNSPNANLALEVSGLREYFAMADSVPDALGS